MSSRRDAEKWNSISTPAVLALLAIVAALLMFPAFFIGNASTHSGNHNHAWIVGIAAEFHEGWIYPRWLSLGFGGLGSPSFYFYPPLPFLFMGGLRAVTGEWLPINAIVQIHACLLFFASGLAMWVWARGFMDRGPALLAGIAYMAMPYHVFNHLVRGAIGEFASYAILPLLLVAVERIARGARFGVPLFAVLYAGLILTHLPIALLASVFVIPVYAVWRNGVGAAALPRYASLALAGLLGLGLAGAYLAPALSLQEHINAQRWWSDYFDPLNWMIWRLVQREEYLFLVLYALYAAYGVALLYLLKKMPARSEHRRLMVFMVVWAWVMILLIAGIFPPVWGGLLERVQFPWRLLVAADLVIAPALVLLAAGAPFGRRPALSGFALTAVFHAGLMTYGFAVHGPDTTKFIPAEPHEYRAVGYDAKAIDPTGPAIMPPAAGAVETRWEGGEMIILVSANSDARVVVPINFFPAWIVTDQAGGEVPVRAETPSRLLSFAVAPGESRFVARRIMLPEERLGWWVSLAAALLVMAGTLSALRQGRRAI